MTAIISCDHSSVKSKTFIAFSKMISLSDPTFSFRGPGGGVGLALVFCVSLCPRGSTCPLLDKGVVGDPRYPLLPHWNACFGLHLNFFFLTQSYMQLRGIRICLFMWLLLACWPPPLTARLSLYLNLVFF